MPFDCLVPVALPMLDRYLIVEVPDAGPSRDQPTCPLDLETRGEHGQWPLG